MIRPLITLFVLLFICACHRHEPATGGLSPREALASFQVADGFKIELIAAEPMISDPVAMDVDEYGNIYVVELHGYPLDTAGTGKIKLLTDTDGDGIPDKAGLFADHLRMPTGIMRWKKGILVVDVPEIIYLEDSDHDGKADIRKTMITGIALTNPQHIANTPVLGIDNWIYLAHMGTITPRVSMEFNDSGSSVRFTGNPAARQLPRNADGRNIRFKPDDFEMEMLSGQSQYGHTFDNWGHHICTDNSDHLFHEVIAARYLQRNPGLPVEDASEYIPDHGNNCEVYPITINPENQLMTGRGIVTSSCGVTWYQGGLFPDSFNHVTFIAEPVSNIVHADRIHEKGATFTASRVYEKKEFLASKDGWFRPVQFYIGPDGALYVIDYYRQIIEHPEWLSEEVTRSGALYNGADKGRIYRITPVATRKMDWCNKIDLGNASTPELVSTLTNNNIWWRRNAQRLLMDRKDSSTVRLLKNLLDTTHSPEATVHALWLLQGFNAINEDILRKGLQHPEAGVRENAIQLAEIHLAAFPGLSAKLIAMQHDSSAKVRYQLLCTLGNRQDAAATAARQHILMHDIEDKWVQTAALTASGYDAMELLANSIRSLSISAPSEGKASFLAACAGLVGHSGNAEGIKKVIRLCTNKNEPEASWWQSACLKGLASAAPDKQPTNLESEKNLLLEKFSPYTTPLVRSASIDLLHKLGIVENNNWKACLQKAVAAIQDTLENRSFRNDAIRLIALDKKGDYRSLLENLIISAEPAGIRQTALQTYNRLAPRSAADCIVRNWKTLPQDLHEVAMNVFLSSSGNARILLDAVKDGVIQSTSISWPAKEELANNDDETVRNRARQLIISEIQNREEAYKQYLPVLSMKGDTAKGLLIFTTVCGVCHQYEHQHGKTFGPDLGSIRNREKSSIMADVLNPNRSIAVNYDFWTVTKTDGERISGIVSSETSSAITLNQSGGQHVTVPRTAIKTMETAESSAMPVGLEKSLSKEQMANLLAFLTNKE